MMYRVAEEAAEPSDDEMQPQTESEEEELEPVVQQPFKVRAWMSSGWRATPAA